MPVPPRRDLILEVIVIVLIGVEIVLSVVGIVIGGEEGRRQVGVLDQLNASASETAKSLRLMSQEQQQLVATQEKTLDTMSTMNATMQNEFEIIREQRRRELEQPEVEGILLYPQQPSIVINSISKTKVARDVIYEARFWNLDKPTEEGFALVSSKVGSVASVRPGGSFGPFNFELFSGANAPASLPSGTRLFGYVTVQCPECRSVHIYWAYYVVGNSGVYREGRWTDCDWYHLSRSNVGAALASFQSHKDLKQMPTRWP
jgi:hypothetical protein